MVLCFVLCALRLGFRVWGLGFGVQKYRVQGLGSRNEWLEMTSKILQERSFNLKLSGNGIKYTA